MDIKCCKPAPGEADHLGTKERVRKNEWDVRTRHFVVIPGAKTRLEVSGRDMVALMEYHRA